MVAYLAHEWVTLLAALSESGKAALKDSNSVYDSAAESEVTMADK